MTTSRTILLKYALGVLIPVAIAVGAAWQFWGVAAHAPGDQNASQIAPIVQSVVKATVGNYARLAADVGYVDQATLDGLLASSSEVAFIQIHDARRRVKLRAATNGRKPVRLPRLWTIDQAAFGFHAIDVPAVVAPIPSGGWMMIGLDFDAFKTAWGLPRSLVFAPVEPQDKPHQIVRLEQLALPGEGPWRCAVDAVATKRPAYANETIGVGLLILFIGLFSAFIMARGVRRRFDRLQRDVHEAWTDASSRLTPDIVDLALMARVTAAELRDLRDREDELATEVIRLEHTEKELKQRVDELAKSQKRSKEEADHASRALAQARDQIRQLEATSAGEGLLDGDTWFAAVVRDALARRRDDADSAEILDRIAGIADQAQRGMKDALEVVNLGERLNARLEAANTCKQLKVLVSPFANRVFANQYAVDLLIERLLDTIASNEDGEMTLRVWRHRSHQGTEMVRVALERTGAVLKKSVDIVYHGLAALAGATVQSESFGDERSALVLYFEAALVGEDGTAARRDIDPEKILRAEKALDERFATKAAAATPSEPAETEAPPTEKAPRRRIQLGSGHDETGPLRRRLSPAPDRTPIPE